MRSVHRRRAAFVAAAVLLVSLVGSALFWRSLANAESTASFGEQRGFGRP